jgi:aminoglycoside phosphotransferase family enzyme
MRRFPDGALLSDLIVREALFEQHVDALARAVARFHATAPRAGVDTPFGTPDEVLRPALANIEALRPRCPKHAAALAALESWTRAEHARLRATFDARRAGGFVRECHGDLHLGNVTEIDGELAIFDCIEFDERMRWIDVMSEIAFTAMDLEHRGRADLAHRFVNDYLEHTGDYGGVAVLRFYRVYRALVRAKVAALRAAALPDGTRDQAAASAESVAYLDLASRMIGPPSAAIVITHGPSGCGKTTASQALLERLAQTEPRTLACMHGSAWRGDGAALLRGLAKSLANGDRAAQGNGHGSAH